MNLARTLGLASLVSSHIFGHHSFPPWSSEGDQVWKMIPLLWRIWSARSLQIANLGNSCWLISLVIVGIWWIYLTTLYLRFLPWVVEFSISPKKRWDKKVPLGIFSTPSNICSISFVTWCKKVHSYWIAQTTTALLSWGYFPSVLGDRDNVFLPCWCQMF